GAFGDADHAAGIQKIKGVAGLDALVIGRQRQLGLFEQLTALFLGFGEMAEQDFGVRALEIIGGEFLLVLEEDFAIAELVVEFEVVDALDALHIHGKALQAIG